MKFNSPDHSLFLLVLRGLSLSACSALVALVALESQTLAQDEEALSVHKAIASLKSVEVAGKPTITLPVVATVPVIRPQDPEQAAEQQGAAGKLAEILEARAKLQAMGRAAQAMAEKEKAAQAAEGGAVAAADVETTQPTQPIPAPQRPPVSPKFVRFHMWDGSIVGGEVQNDAISVRTEFGSLEVPIEEIKRFYPGLNSFPELTAKIDKLVENLGDKNFDVREKSNSELNAMGMRIRNELNRFEDGGSAERKKRIAEIKKNIDQELDSMQEEDLQGDPLNRPLIRGDRVDTPLFSIVGKIEQEEFVLNSKFGELTVKLADVRMADRAFNEVAQSVRKKCEVDGHAFFQKNTYSTRIRLNKGDKVSITADGVIQWTNWSTSSTPDGLANQGMYQNIQGGTLCARVGSTGKVIKIGSKGSFVVKKPGILYLAIAMQDSYANNSAYRWVGKYKARVEVKPVVAK